MELPTGLLTLVFTDIQDSSDLSEQYRENFEPLRAQHFQILREAASRWRGVEVSTAGDALFLVFERATDAVQWAVDVQHLLGEYDWPTLSSSAVADGKPQKVDVRVRIGMHTGEPFLSRDAARPDYFGPAVNRAARVSSAAHGGQILVSNATYSLVQFDLPTSFTFLDCGLQRLKGVGEDNLWQVQAPHLRTTFPPLKTLNPQRHNLPALSTAFLGRDQEIQAWLEKLREPTTRLLTLTGFGGLGKTRSALQLAELSLDDYKDGVWWVEAEEARTGEELVQRIAGALSLAPRSDTSFQEQVRRHLHTQNLLLVLDNTEQIADAGRVIHVLMSQAPQVRFLVTSRRALEIQGERVIELSPLPLAEAAQLFVERVRDRQPAFELTPENNADVKELCSRLEGVPLALELAASRINTMAPRQILQRLNERFKLLQTRAPDLPERQRALRAAIDWSYDILSEEDKFLFAQVSAFASGFTLDDAEAVCEAFDVLEGIAELRRHSLLRSETEAETQQTRFVMLNSLREYAQEKLAATPESDAVYLRHARYFLEYARQRLEKLRTPEEAKALRDLKWNDGNLRAGIEAAQRLGQTELFAQLGLMRSRSLWRRGYAQEAVLPLQAALDVMQPTRTNNLSLYAELLWERAGLYRDLQEMTDAETLAKEALELFTGMENRLWQARAEGLLGIIARETQRYASARLYFEQAVKRLHSPDEDSDIANIYTNWGYMESMESAGNLDAARRLLEEAMQRRRKQGDRRGLAETLNNLGVVAFSQQDWEQAWRSYSEALAHEQALDNTYGIAQILYNLGEVAHERGETMRALRLFAASEFLMEAVKSPVVRIVADYFQSVARAAGKEADLPMLREAAATQAGETLVAWATAI